MTLLWEIIVTFFAGMGAGLGTGFAGMSAAAVISPVLITFLGVDPYMAVGIALSSDVLASAVSAYTYKKNKNLDIKNGLIMMVSVLIFTVVGSYISSLVPSAAMGNFSVFMTFLLGIKFIVKPVMTTKEAMEAVSPEKESHPVRGLWNDDRIYLRICRCRRWNDDASYFDICSGIRVKDRSRNQRIYHDIYGIDRRGIPFCDRRHAGLDCLDFVRSVYPDMGKNRSGICQQGCAKDLKPGDGYHPCHSGTGSIAVLGLIKS